MTFTEKILKGNAGQTVDVMCDRFVLTDANAETVVPELVKRTCANDRLMMFVDHIYPSTSEEDDLLQISMRTYAKEHSVEYNEGRGISYVILAEKILKAGECVCCMGKHSGTVGASGVLAVRVDEAAFVNAVSGGGMKLTVPSVIKIDIKGSIKDGHDIRDILAPYISGLAAKDLKDKALEICGDGLAQLSLSQRITMCNLFTTLDVWSVVINDEEPAADEEYWDIVKVDLGKCEEMVALPYDMQFVSVEELEPVKIASAFVGGCAGGSIEDLRAVADVLKGKKVKKYLRFLVSPATQECYLQAMNEGIMNILVESGAMIANPHCCTCYGKTQGTIAKGEAMVSTGICNKAGTAGPAEGKVYLASAKTVAECALTGYLGKKEGH